MPARSYLERLRSQGGPSHELLVLLDQHRVLTTDQLARASGTPIRTVRYRMERLLEHGLVDQRRPGRETGSAPRHWWLRPAGARLVAGTAAAAGRPSGMFAAHAAAIAEVWLALREYGPDAGVEVTGWWADRAGWQEWQPRHGYRDGLPHRLTPDAVLHAQITGDAGAGATAAFVEVDLASMSQTQLREKVGRYLAYAEDGAWMGTHPHCPPLLLLTTTTARAVTFLRAAGRLLTEHRRAVQYGAGPAAADIAHADRLVVAACGMVRDPARAVVEACGLLPADDAAQVGLGELLAERVRARARADDWLDQLDAHRVRRERIEALHELARDDDLPQLLGDPAAADALVRLTVTDDGADGLLEREPELVDTVLAWHRDGADVAPVRELLRRRHRQLWAGQVEQLLAADRLVAAEPKVTAYAVRLAAGRLLDRWQLADVADPPGTPRDQLQAAALTAYHARRDAAVAREHQALPWRTRRRTSLADLAAAYDAQWLQVCDICRMFHPRPNPEHSDPWIDTCPHCHVGDLVDHDQAARIPDLDSVVDDLRRQLHQSGVTGG